MFDWQDLRFFLAAARLGSLTAAADELGVDQSTVGRRISKLETAVGMKLIQRLPRATRLTEQGMALASVAGTIEGDAEAIIRHLRGQTAELSGQVVVSALPALAAFIIAPSFPVLLARHPGIRLVLSATSAVASLERGEADSSIGFVRPSLPGRVVRQIGQLGFALYGASRFADRATESWTCIGFEDSLSGIMQQQWFEKFAAGRPFVLRTNDVATQIQGARAGLGVALLPCLLGDAEPDLVRFETDRCPPPRPLWLSVHADIRRSLVVRAVMDHLTEIFAT